MNLYLVTRNGEIDYDEVSGFVVAAPSGQRARERACSDNGDEGDGPWLDQRRSAVHLVGTGPGPERIILRDKRES